MLPRWWGWLIIDIHIIEEANGAKFALRGKNSDSAKRIVLRYLRCMKTDVVCGKFEAVDRKPTLELGFGFVVEYLRTTILSQ